MANNVYTDNIQIDEVALADAGTSTASYLLNGRKLIGVKFPSGVTASTFNVQVSEDNSTWDNIFDKDGVQLTVARNVGRCYFAPQDVAHLSGYVRLTGVAQSGAVTLEFLSRPL